MFDGPEDKAMAAGVRGKRHTIMPEKFNISLAEQGDAMQLWLPDGLLELKGEQRDCLVAYITGVRERLLSKQREAQSQVSS